ncbi:hypothetical protein KY285_010716 [Solanum tuberosum]|nr:hypothetical protein KY289_012788 [Solanum tuberosum]KAH0735009.1 hypothetical protein KY285_010716 [Solanum tuberosum]
MIFNSSYQIIDLEIEVTEEEYREWYIPRALRSFFCYSPAALGVLLVDFQLIASTYRLSAKSLSGSSYYIPSLLSISTVDAIEALNAISGGENIPAATIGVDGTSSVRVRALAGITSASYLTVGGETLYRLLWILSASEAKLLGRTFYRDSSLRNALSFLLKSKTQLDFDTGANHRSTLTAKGVGQLELDERQACNFKEARSDPRTGQKTGPTVIPRATVREGSLSLVHQKPSSPKVARSVLVSPKRRKEGHERHREDSRTRHDSDPGKFDLHWPCCPQIDYSPLKVKPILRQFMVSGIGHPKGRREGCADQFNFSLCHLEIVCLELGYGVGRECQYISSSSSKAKISINSIILPLFASEAVSSLSRSSRSSKWSLLILILLKEEVNKSRFLRTSVLEGVGLLLTDIRSGIQNRGRAALLILLLMERHKKHHIKHARSLSKPLLAYQARPVRTSPQFSILIELGRIALPTNNLLTLSLQAPWSHLSLYSIVLFGTERKRSAFCRKNRSKARYGPSLPLRHPPPYPIHSPQMSTRNLKKKDKEIQLEISCP